MATTKRRDANGTDNHVNKQKAAAAAAIASAAADVAKAANNIASDADTSLHRRRGPSFSANLASGISHEEETKIILDLVNDTKHFSLIRALQIADYVTEMNCFCGVSSIFCSFQYVLGDSGDPSFLYIAVLLIPLAGFFDCIDGKIARWQQKSSIMGRQLDSLADLVSFGVAPTVCALAWGLRTRVDMLLMIFFVQCGLSRLARFNLTTDALPKDPKGKTLYFEGLPIPSSVSLVMMIGLSVYYGFFNGHILFGTLFAGTQYEMHPFALLYVLYGCAMTSKTLHVLKI